MTFEKIIQRTDMSRNLLKKKTKAANNHDDDDDDNDDDDNDDIEDDDDEKEEALHEVVCHIIITDAIGKSSVPHSIKSHLISCGGILHPNLVVKFYLKMYMFNLE